MVVKGCVAPLIFVGINEPYWSSLLRGFRASSNLPAAAIDDRKTSSAQFIGDATNHAAGALEICGDSICGQTKR